MHINKMYAALAAAALAAGLGALAVAEVVNDGTFVPNDQPVGYVAQPVPSTLNVATATNARMYATDYDSSNWGGNLHAYTISAEGVIGTVDQWPGGAQKLLEDVEVPTRKIVTIRDGSGIEFKWSALSDAQKEVIDPVAKATAGSTSSPMLNYLRGDKSNEGTGEGKFRARASTIGDIIHSTPVYFSKDGINTVFVGANDGMLHAFDTATGNERFAYVPKTVFPNLTKLAAQPYIHQYYVDGRLDVRYFEAQDKAMLVGLLGAGGKGLFGLDVTNLSDSALGTAAGTVKWEKNSSDTGFTDLGYTYGAPTLFNLAADTPALAVGNGYNSTDGKAVLYIINPISGAILQTHTVSEVGANGLSSPSLWDTNNDGYQDVAYAGDIKGNLWKFDLVVRSGGLTAPVKLHSGNGVATAITMAPAIMKHPVRGQMVTFVTGRMLSQLDRDDGETLHYAYGVWDGAGATQTEIVEQTLTAHTTAAPASLRLRTASKNAVNWTTAKGWKTRLPTGGERVIGDGAFILNGVFQFFSTNPTASPTGTPPGENWWMQLDGLTGGAIPNPVFDLNDDKRFGTEDMVAVTVGTEVTYVPPVGRFMGGGVRSQLIGLTAKGVDIYHSNYDKNGTVRPPSVDKKEKVFSGSRGVDGGHFDTTLFCYVNCGSYAAYNYVYGGKTYTSWYNAYYPEDDSGWYGLGTEASSSTKATSNMKHTHVHEYDDMYDKLGQSYIRPSQNLQRLQKTKTGTARTTDTPALAPLQAAKAAAPGAAVSTGAWVNTSETNKSSPPAAIDPVVTYAVGTPSARSDVSERFESGQLVSFTTRTYPITMTRKEWQNVRKSSGKYDQQTRTLTYTWTMTREEATVYANFEFKVLMSNQALSPAVTMKVLDTSKPAADNYNGSVLNFQTSATLDATNLPRYRVGEIGDLGTSMPLDAFTKKDWGTGVVRVGLHPVRPGCVGVAEGGGMTLGKENEWRNGALTVQIVEPTVTTADVQLNVPGKPMLGYRLKSASLKTKLIAEYLIYWHHPSNKCYSDSDWTMTPDPDTKAGGTSSTPYPGTLDPAGEFVHAPGTIPPKPADPAPVETVAPDGTRTIVAVTYHDLAGGGYVERTTTTTIPPTVAAGGGVVTGGAVSGEGVINTGGASRNRLTIGRINWRELQK